MLAQDGRLPVGTGLPGERDLAAALDVSRTTVTAAYSLLRQTGYLDSRQGARSTVALPGGDVDAATTGLRFGPVGTAPGGLIDLSYAAPPALPQVGARVPEGAGPAARAPGRSRARHRRHHAAAGGDRASGTPSAACRPGPSRSWSPTAPSRR